MINETGQFDTSSSYQIKRLQIFIPHRNNLYVLQYDAEPSKFSAFLPVIEKMISSFEITNDKKNLNLYKSHIPQFQAAKEKMTANNSRAFIATPGAWNLIFTQMMFF